MPHPGSSDEGSKRSEGLLEARMQELAEARKEAEKLREEARAERDPNKLRKKLRVLLPVLRAKKRSQ